MRQQVDLSRVLAQMGIGYVLWNALKMPKTSCKKKRMAFLLVSYRQRH